MELVEPRAIAAAVVGVVDKKAPRILHVLLLGLRQEMPRGNFARAAAVRLWLRPRTRSVRDDRKVEQREQQRTK